MPNLEASELYFDLLLDLRNFYLECDLDARLFVCQIHVVDLQAHVSNATQTGDLVDAERRWVVNADLFAVDCYPIQRDLDLKSEFENGSFHAGFEPLGTSAKLTSALAAT